VRAPTPGVSRSAGKSCGPRSGRGEGAVEAPREHVAWPHIVVRRHDEMRQPRQRRRLRTAETAESLLGPAAS
jgi:hypothetical protein